MSVVDPDPVRRALAARFGADETSAPGGDAAADVVIELSGQPEAVEEGLVRAGLGARVVLVGSVAPSRPVALDPERVVRGLVRIEGVHNYRPQDLGTAVEFLGGPGTSYPFVELVGAVYPLAQVDRAVAEALTGAAVRVGVRP